MAWLIKEYDGVFEIYDSIFNYPAFYVDSLEEAIDICTRHGVEFEYQLEETYAYPCS